MKRIRSKKIIKKIVSKRRVISKVSNNIQREESFYISDDNNDIFSTTYSENNNTNSNESLQETLSDRSYYEQNKYNETESNFTTTSDTLSNSDQSTQLLTTNFTLNETEQQNRKPLQTIVENETTNFQPLSVIFTTGSFIKYQDKGTRIGRIIAIVSTSNGTKLKIQLLYYGTELPGNFTSSLRIKRAQNGELWLSEISVLIDLQNVIGPVDVWLRDTPKLSDNYQFCIREILYSHEGRWKIRDIKLRNQHPNEKIEELNILVQESASQKTIIPQDAYHAVAGKIQRLMECTFSILKPDGEVAFINYWKNLETPAGLGINFTSKTTCRLNKITSKMPSPIQIVNAIISCWVTIAKASHLCFSLTFTEQAYKELEKLLRIEHNILLKLDLIRRHNTLQTIRYLTDGGVDNRFPCIKQGFQKLTTDPLLHSILSDWYMTQIIQKEDITDISNTNVVSCDSRVTNIKLYKKLSKIEIQQYNLPVRLDENSQFAHDILIAYDIYMQKKAALIYRRVEFYNQIKYTLLDDDGRFNSHLNLRVGDIVQIQEEENLSYAKIRALFTHKYNNG
ncbi:unnamed protein product [Rhizophagus irregularis]|nr:unnamed protein product [Rhizophagus irregularis]